MVLAKKKSRPQKKKTNLNPKRVSKRKQVRKKKIFSKKKPIIKTLSASPLTILLTGVPATGKTTLAKAWCQKMGWAYLSLNEMVEEQKLYSGVDEEDMAKVVRLTALETAANAWLRAQKGPCVVDGHLGCEIELDVMRVLVVRLNPNELAKRLEARGYIPSKVRENKMAELLDYCTVRAVQVYGAKKVYEMDETGKTPDKNLAEFAGFASAATPPDSFRPHVNWGDELFKEVDIYKSVIKEGHVHRT